MRYVLSGFFAPAIAILTGTILTGTILTGTISLAAEPAAQPENVTKRAESVAQADNLVTLAVPATKTFSNLEDVVEAFENERVSTPTPVDLHATLTCWDPAWEIVFVSEGYVGCYVHIDWAANAKTHLRVGSRVRIQGVAKPGNQMIDEAVVSVVSVGELPDPHFISIASLSPWEFTSCYVQTDGIVEQIAVLHNPPSYLLTLRNSGTNFIARIVVEHNETLIHRMLGARLQFRGVLAPLLDDAGRPRIHVCHVVDPATIFYVGESKRQPVVYQQLDRGQTSEISSDPRWSGKFVKLRGQVANRREGEYVTLDDHGGSIRMTTAITKFLPEGTILHVEGRVLGFADSVKLKGEILRVAGIEPLPPAETSTASEIVKSRSSWRRLSISGTLDRVKHKPVGVRELMITDKGVTFRAVFSATDEELQELELGSAEIIRCIGTVNFEELDADTKFTLYTSSENVQVESRRPPPLFTGSTIAVLAGIGTIIGLGFLSSIILRNRTSPTIEQVPHEASEQSTPLISAFDSVLEGVLIFDAAGRLTHFNNRIDEVLRVACRVGDDVSTTFARISVVLKDDLVLRTAWQEFGRHAVSRSTIDMQVATRDGRHIAVFSAPIADRLGVVNGRIWRFEDVTETLDLEERLVQSQKMEAVGRLAGGIAHDFNNLLMGITTNLDLAKDQAQEECMPFIKDAEIATNRAADLVSHLLEFSRKSPLDRRRASLNVVVARVIKLLERSFDSTIELSASLSPDLGDCKIDTVQMEQVLINLCINARDALPEVGGHIRIVTGNSLESGDHVQLSVEDNGHGMDGATRAKIFEPFFTTKEIGKGTGLGLAMTYGIVKQHGGHIECTSSIGEGTCIDVFIPRSDGIDDDEYRPAVVEKPRHLLGDGQVLLADDDDIVRASLETMLSSRGYEVTAVATGREAIDAFDNGGPFEVVILDRTMPVLSGYEAFKIIADRDPTVPVVILSGYVCDPDDLKDENGRAPNAVITKPCTADRLIAVLQRLRQEYVR